MTRIPRWPAYTRISSYRILPSAIFGKLANVGAMRVIFVAIGDEDAGHGYLNSWDATIPTRWRAKVATNVFQT